MRRQFNRCYPASDLEVFTHHWPKSDTDSAGIFVKRWVDELRARGLVIHVNPKSPGNTAVFAAHWLWPSAVRVFLLHLRHRKPFIVVLHGDPFMIERHWWVRLIALPILRRAKAVQVVSETCHKIMERYGISSFVAAMPDGVGDRKPGPA